MEKNIPDEVRKQIEEKILQLYPKMVRYESTGSKTLYPHRRNEYYGKVFTRGAEFGYSLVSKAISDAKAENERFDNLVNTFYGKMGSLADEVKRLRGLIDEAYIAGWRSKYKSSTLSEHIQEFKTENNL